MLIALFTILFLSGSSSSPFVVPKAEKLIKQVVQDDQRKDSILTLMADYKADWKALQKEKKAQSKEVKAIIEDQQADINQVSGMMQNHRDKRNLLNQELIAYRLAIVDILTDEEKADLSARIREKFEKNEEKFTKSGKKALDKAAKRLADIEEAIVAAYDDPATQIEASRLLNAFSTDIIDLLEQNKTYARNTMTMNAKLSSDSQKHLSEMVYQIESYRAKAHTSFVLLYQGLVKITPPEDWGKVSKQLKKLI